MTHQLIADKRIAPWLIQKLKRLVEPHSVPHVYTSNHFFQIGIIFSNSRVLILE